jgi:hypothetical protein
MKATTCTNIFLSLVPIALFLQASNVSAGWLGYDNYEECFAAERQERMDRWISPMNAVNASVAAHDTCQKYIKPYSPDPEKTKAISELQQREAQAREEKMRGFTGPCTIQAQVAGYCTWQQYLDRNAEESIEAERQRKVEELRLQVQRFEAERRAEENRMQIEYMNNRIRQELYPDR